MGDVPDGAHLRAAHLGQHAGDVPAPRVGVVRLQPDLDAPRQPARRGAEPAYRARIVITFTKASGEHANRARAEVARQFRLGEQGGHDLVVLDAGRRHLHVGGDAQDGRARQRGPRRPPAFGGEPPVDGFVRCGTQLQARPAGARGHRGDLGQREPGAAEGGEAQFAHTADGTDARSPRAARSQPVALGAAGAVVYGADATVAPGLG